MFRGDHKRRRASAYYAAEPTQYHINADIMYACASTAGEWPRGFLRECGAEIVDNGNRCGRTSVSIRTQRREICINAHRAGRRKTRL